jgi:hypothetical protein
MTQSEEAPTRFARIIDDQLEHVLHADLVNQLRGYRSPTRDESTAAGLELENSRAASSLSSWS